MRRALWRASPAVRGEGRGDVTACASPARAGAQGLAWPTCTMSEKELGPGSFYATAPRAGGFHGLLSFGRGSLEKSTQTRISALLRCVAATWGPCCQRHRMRFCLSNSGLGRSVALSGLHGPPGPGPGGSLASSSSVDLGSQPWGPYSPAPAQLRPRPCSRASPGLPRPPPPRMR